MKLGTPFYPIQKYAIKEYLQHDLAALLFDYTLDAYELPKMTDEEKRQVRIDFERNAPDMTKAIFKNEKVAKRFIQRLEGVLAYNGRDTFSYTCRSASEYGEFCYASGQSKEAAKHNASMIRIFNPMLDELAAKVALRIEKTLEDIREAKKNEEIQLVHTLAKKHGLKIR